MYIEKLNPTYFYSILGKAFTSLEIYWIFQTFNIFGNILKISKILHLRKLLGTMSMYNDKDIPKREALKIFTAIFILGKAFTCSEIHILNISYILHPRKYFEDFKIFTSTKTFGQRFAPPKTFLKFANLGKLFYWPFYRISMNISPLSVKLGISW